MKAPRSETDEAGSQAAAAFAQGQALGELGRLDEAATQYARAVALAPQDPAPLCGLSAVRLRLGAHADALTHAEAATALAPETGWPHRLRALALVALERPKEAKEAALAACRLEVEQPWAYIVLSKCLLATRDEAGALRAAAHAVELAPESVETHDQLGHVRLALGNNAGAEQAFRAALAIDPENARVLNNLAVSEGRLRRFDEALDGMERASRSDPSFVLARENILLYGRRAAMWRRGALGCAALGIFLVFDTHEWGSLFVLLVIAALCEARRRFVLDRFPAAARQLITDDARARRFRPLRWDYRWPLRLRPWWWVLLRSAPPPLLLGVNLFAVLVDLTSSHYPAAALFALGLPVSGWRTWRWCRQRYPGAGSWRPPQ